MDEFMGTNKEQNGIDSLYTGIYCIKKTAFQISREKMVQSINCEKNGLSVCQKQSQSSNSKRIPKKIKIKEFQIKSSGMDFPGG